MESEGTDRGPGSVAAHAVLRDVWSVERSRPVEELVAAAVRNDEPAITALRALRGVLVPPPLLGRVLALADVVQAPVRCRQVNQDNGVYELTFFPTIEARKVVAEHARHEHIPRLVGWLCDRADRAGCASDPDPAPLAAYARALFRLAPDDDAIVRALVEVAGDPKMYDSEIGPIFDLLVGSAHPEARAFVARALAAPVYSTARLLHALARHGDRAHLHEVSGLVDRLLASPAKRRAPLNIESACLAARALGASPADRARWSAAIRSLARNSSDASARFYFERALAGLEE